MTDVGLSRAGWLDLDVGVAYALLRLRVDVFVVEQACPYPELDGRDLDATTDHLWLHPVGDPADVRAYLRVLSDGEDRRIGRVVTSAAYRGQGLSARLVREVVAEQGGTRALVLDAQSHLSGWYGRFGFRADGEDFVEDGIPHTPMRRPAGL